MDTYTIGQSVVLVPKGRITGTVINIVNDGETLVIRMPNGLRTEVNIRDYVSVTAE